MNFKIELEREDDGRWVAEVPDLPGVMTYAQSRDEAIAHVQALALRVLADRLDHGEGAPDRDGWPNVAFAFHDNEEIGPKMLARIAKHTGLKPEDL